MPSDLEIQRDHLRAIAESEHRSDCVRERHEQAAWLGYCHNATVRRCRDAEPHDPHRITDWTACPGVCPGCNPARDRELARVWADEMTKRLAGGDDEEGLFE